MTLRTQIKEFNNYLKNNESILDRDFKHVADKIQLHWGYPEFYPFINQLFVTGSERKRGGFPPEVMQEIYALHDIHSKLYPQKNS